MRRLLGDRRERLIAEAGWAWRRKGDAVGRRYMCFETCFEVDRDTMGCIALRVVDLMELRRTLRWES